MARAGLLDSFRKPTKDVDDVHQKKSLICKFKGIRKPLGVPLGEIPPLLLCQLAMSQRVV